MSIVLNSASGGSITLNEPATAVPVVQTLAAADGTLAPIVSGTAQASTSGTSRDFTGIPSWAKRITVMLYGVSTNGISPFLFQLGAGSVTTSGYNSMAGTITTTANTTAGSTSTAGFLSGTPTAASVAEGMFIFTLLNSNSWVGMGSVFSGTNRQTNTTGSIALSGTLDRIRITTVNGTDTFDAGTINILYE